MTNDTKIDEVKPAAAAEEGEAITPQRLLVGTTTTISATTTTAATTTTKPPTTTTTLSSTVQTTATTTTTKPIVTTTTGATTTATTTKPLPLTTPPLLQKSVNYNSSNEAGTNITFIDTQSVLTTTGTTRVGASPSAMYAVIGVFTGSLLLIASAALIFLFVYRRKRYQERKRLPKFENPQYSSSDFKNKDYKLYVGNTVDLNSMDRSSHWATGNGSANNTLKRRAPPPPNPFGDDSLDNCDIYEIESSPSVENIALGTFASTSNNRYLRNQASPHDHHASVEDPLLSSSSEVEVDSYYTDSDADISEAPLPPPPPQSSIPIHL